MIAIMILLIAAALVLLLAYLAYRRAFHVSPAQRRKPLPLPGGEQYLQVQDRSRALMEEMAVLPYESVRITAWDGTELAARYYHIRDGAPLQIQFHGYRSNSIRDFCGGHKLAREAGFNTLVVDQRAHGESGGHVITFGIWEKQDCLSWLEYAVKRFGSEIPIFLAGVSMGAATVIMATELQLPKNVLGVIADCPYSSPEGIIRKVCRDMKLPPAAAFPFVRLGARIFGGFDICADGAAQAAARSPVPILLIHGEDDRFVPCEMSAEIHAANPAKITLATFPDAGHGLSYIMDTDRYAHLAHDFIAACLKNPY